MKTIIALSFMLMIPFTLNAQTLTWDANTEADMKDYGVYSCVGVGCVVVKSPATLKAFVTHPSTIFAIPTLTEGAFAVTARDLALNESGLSVSVPLDVAPRIPVNPRLQP